jgi:uncharacterized protein YecE (DUF72 family)
MNKKAGGAVRVGVGGWTYAPWRGTFYPPNLPHAKELSHASRRITSIEINGTFYRTQSASSFAKWRDETPENFVFSVKGHRAVVNSKKLADSGETIDWFLKSGVLELREKLGPILWQLAPFKRFDAEDVGAFLKLLPKERNGRALRHALEVRHASFEDPAFATLARENNVAIVYADSDEYPAIADVTADFVYARLQRSREDEPAGYAVKELDAWAERARTWTAGGAPSDLPYLATDARQKRPKTKTPARDVFMFFIAGDKVRAPAAAEALIARLAQPVKRKKPVTG